MIDRRLVANFDWTLMGVVLAIVLIGMVNLYSSTASYQVVGTSYLVKQLYWLLLGLFVGLMVCSIDYHLAEDTAYWVYGVTVLLLLLVLMVGRTSLGATRWLRLGPMNLQPSELMKIVIIVTYAAYFSSNPVVDGLRLRDLGFPALFLLLPVLLIMKQPDLGTAVIITLIAFSLLVYVGVRWQTFMLLAIAIVPTIFLSWNYYLRDYQKNRILNFLDPERDPLGSGYHIIQSKIAVGSGEIFGKGYLTGSQSQLHFLPEQHTDFAFSVFAEEWGLIGCLVVLFLYFSLILWGLYIARRCNDRFGSMLAVGVVAMLFWHAVINIGMVIGLFPVVGVPLPFFSYGGTSMITSMIGAGLLMNVSIRRFMF
ncbi:MAG TPA: rod shape-determining protein RodA [Geobacterales bacterium]|nr:rod shape-determining protein RodA [Geobacterales bacterium]